MSNEEYIKLEARYIHDRSWFIVYTVAFIFGIVWTLLGDSNVKLVFITAAFMCFLRAGIDMEMSARALHGGDSH